MTGSLFSLVLVEAHCTGLVQGIWIFKFGPEMCEFLLVSVFLLGYPVFPRKLLRSEAGEFKILRAAAEARTQLSWRCFHAASGVTGGRWPARLSLDSSLRSSFVERRRWPLVLTEYSQCVLLLWLLPDAAKDYRNSITTVHLISLFKLSTDIIIWR
jgi:hypothetical protein